MSDVLDEVATEDRRLEQEKEKATEQLAYLRWHWTLDKDNPDKVSFAKYARKIGRAASVVSKFARGYAMWKNHSVQSAITECIARADLSEREQLYVQTVADVRGIAFTSAKSNNYADVKKIRTSVAEEEARRVDADELFTAEDVEKYVRTIAEQIVADEKAAEERKARETQYAGHVMAVLSQLETAKNAFDRAHTQIIETHDLFTTDEQDVVIDKIDRVKGSFEAAVEPFVVVDWDSQLKKLTSGGM